MPDVRIPLIAAAVVALHAGSARAAEPTNITAGELALTPSFCQDVQTINGWTQYSRESPRSPYWVSIMGKTFWGMHHYCWALINIHRSRAAGLSPQQRHFMIQSAIADYIYVVRIAPPDFVLLPEIFHLIGEAHVMVDEYVPAIEAFQKSISLKADYWPPYEAHAKLLDRVGKRGEALSVLEAGLAVMPNEQRLLDLYVRLGGQPRKLRPAAPAPAAAASAPPAR